MTEHAAHELYQEQWAQFIEHEQLTPQQAEQFKSYARELVAWNNTMNLTAITHLPTILTDHFMDSLALLRFVSFAESDWLCDVGSGAGFPGIPLKIMCPDVPMKLIEVNSKKIRFLQAMIEQLGLRNIELVTLDWRTFIHKAPFPITYFLARASLKPEELLRVFTHTHEYPRATLVYWASQHWQPSSVETRFLVADDAYEIGTKKRRLIFFKNR